MKAKLITLLAITLLTLNTNAEPNDTTIRPNPAVKTIYGEHGHEQQIEDAFKENKPADKSVAGTPHFAIVGKYKKFFLGIGANFKAYGTFDFGADMPSSLDFVPSQIQPAMEGNGSKLSFSVEPSSIYLNFVAMPDNPNKTGLFFSGNFRGGDYKFQLNHLYFKYRGLTFGYTDGAFTDSDADPYIIDDAGISGKGSKKTFSAYWEQPFGKGFSGALGLDAPEVELDDVLNNTTVSKINQRVPSFPLWVQYANDNSHIRFTGLLRTMQYRDLIANCNRSILGWGVKLTGSYKPCSYIPLKFYYGAIYGEGITEYINDLNDLDIDALPSIDKSGKMSLTRSWSGHIGLEYRFTDKITSNLVYSRAGNYYDKTVVISSDMHKYGEYVTANLLYNITYFMKVGLEYNWGYKKTMNNDNLHANRFQLLFAIEI